MAVKLSIRSFALKKQYHTHDYHQFVFPLSGKADNYIQRETYRISPGQCIFHPAGIKHIFTADKKSRYLVADIDELPEKFRIKDITILSVPPPLQFFCVFAEKQLDYRVNPVLEKSIGNLFEVLIRELDFQPKIDFRIARVIAYFENDISHTSSLEELASIAGLSLSRFKVLFKSETGETPGNYLRNLRMEKAKALVLNTDYPISIIAEMAGYNDSSSFSHRFSSHFGFPPKNFR